MIVVAVEQGAQLGNFERGGGQGFIIGKMILYIALARLSNGVAPLFRAMA